MTLGEALLVVATGLGAGVLSSTVGVASLLSFPVLVALGLPALVREGLTWSDLRVQALSSSPVRLSSKPPAREGVRI